MLNTEEQPEHPQITSTAPSVSAESDVASAATARVSASEFTAAIQALEQRKAEEARRYANTVEVGKTIQDLNIDATPEDVMREVQAQRAARNGPRLAGVPPHSQLTESQAATREQLRTAAAMLKGYYDKNISPNRVQIGVPESLSRRGMRPFSKRQWGAAIGMIAAMAYLVNNIGHLGLFDDDQKAFPQQTIAGQSPLSSLGEDEAGSVDVDGLATIVKARGVVNSTDQNVQLTSGSSKSTFVVAKHGGKLYLEGFTGTIGLKGLTGGDVMIYSQDNGGELEGDHYDAVTVPLADVGFIASDKHANWSSITVNNIHLDSYTRSEYGF